MKNYKILKILPLYYSDLITNIYRDNPYLYQLSYDEQKIFINSQGFVHLNGFARCMNQLKNEATEIICDIEILQKTWAKENNKYYDEEFWSWQIVLHQINSIKPDIIYLQDIHPLPHIIRRQLKKDFPFIKLISMFKGFPSDPTELSDIDILFAGIPPLQNHYYSLGYNSFLMYHCINPDIVNYQSDVVETDDPLYNFTFFGSSGFGTGGHHQKRYDTLFELLKHTNITCWLSESENRNISKTKDRPLSEIFADKTEPPKYGRELILGLRKSKLTFNIHTEKADGAIGNMRLFVATGAGTCLLTDSGHNVKDLFEPDKEIATYQSLDECIEKATYLLSHDDLRRSIAKAGQERTLRDHSVMRRCEKIHEIFQEYL